jgi:hypothetical protein
MARKQLSRDEIADLIDTIALRIEGGDQSFDLYTVILRVQEGLIGLRHKEGSIILLRIGMLILNHDRKRPIRYPYVQETLDKLEPLDPIEDSENLKSLAVEIRERK